MAMTISATTLTYNDGSTNTTNIQNTTAGLGAGAIGSYASLTFPGNAAQRDPGYEVAGSSLRYSAGMSASTPAGSPTTPGGSWRLMGQLVQYTVPGTPGYSSPKGFVPATPSTTAYTYGAAVWLRYA